MARRVTNLLYAGFVTYPTYPPSAHRLCKQCQPHVSCAKLIAPKRGREFDHRPYCRMLGRYIIYQTEITGIEMPARSDGHAHTHAFGGDISMEDELYALARFHGAVCRTSWDKNTIILSWRRPCPILCSCQRRHVSKIGVPLFTPRCPAVDSPTIILLNLRPTASNIKSIIIARMSGRRRCPSAC